VLATFVAGLVGATRGALSLAPFRYQLAASVILLGFAVAAAVREVTRAAISHALAAYSSMDAVGFFLRFDACAGYSVEQRL
jgi:hypothetical protein